MKSLEIVEINLCFFLYFGFCDKTYFQNGESKRHEGITLQPKCSLLNVCATNI